MHKRIYGNKNDVDNIQTDLKKKICNVRWKNRNMQHKLKRLQKKIFSKSRLKSKFIYLEWHIKMPSAPI